MARLVIYFYTILSALLAVSLCNHASKDELLEHAKELKRNASEALQFYHENHFSDQVLVEQLTHLQSLVGEISRADNTTTELADLLEFSFRLNSIQCLIRENNQTAHEFVRERAQISALARQTVVNAEKLDLQLQTQHRTDEANRLRSNIVLLRSMIARIDNVHDNRKLAQVKEEFKSVQNKLLTQMLNYQNTN